MKYYSEILKNFFDTAEACEEAELEYKKAEDAKNHQREEIIKELKAAEEKVQNALNNYVEARAVYNDLITKYGRDYVKKPLTYRELLSLLFNP